MVNVKGTLDDFPSYWVSVCSVEDNAEARRLAATSSRIAEQASTRNKDAAEIIRPVACPGRQPALRLELPRREDYERSMRA